MLSLLEYCLLLYMESKSTETHTISSGELLQKFVPDLNPEISSFAMPSPA